MRTSGARAGRPKKSSISPVYSCSVLAASSGVIISFSELRSTRYTSCAQQHWSDRKRPQRNVQSVGQNKKLGVIPQNRWLRECASWQGYLVNIGGREGVGEVGMQAR